MNIKALEAAAEIGKLLQSVGEPEAQLKVILFVAEMVKKQQPEEANIQGKPAAKIKGPSTDLITYKEAAALRRVPVQTIYDWVTQSRLRPHVTATGRKLSRADVQAIQHRRIGSKGGKTTPRVGGGSADLITYEEAAALKGVRLQRVYQLTSAKALRVYQTDEGKRLSRAEVEAHRDRARLKPTLVSLPADLISYKEAAELTGIRQATIADMCYRKTLKKYVLGRGEVKVSRAEVEAYANQGQPQQAQATLI